MARIPRTSKPADRNARPQRPKMVKRPSVTSTESRTQRATAILDAWDRSRQPFVLYLRKFGMTMYHGPAQRMLLENHFWATLSLDRIGVVTIVDPNEDPLPGAYGHGAPALAVANDKWQGVVSDLISKAEMIVSEVPLLGPGAAFELDQSERAAKIAQTVVIIPPADGPFPAIDDEPPVKSFPRVIHYDELPGLNAKDHFVFHDLLDRMRAIASLEPTERRALVDSGQIDTRFPVTFAGVREGYEKNATDYETNGDLRNASRSHFRALVVAAAQGNDAAGATAAENIARIALAIGDRAAAVNYLRGAISLAERVHDMSTVQRLRERLVSLDV